MLRNIVWIRAAEKQFLAFPLEVRERMVAALRTAARGEKADIAKPLTGLGGGVFEVALPYRGDAY